MEGTGADLILLARWREGDEASAHLLVQRHYPWLLNLFYRLTGTRHSAEELTQELFLRLTAQVAKAQPIHQLGAWLRTAALNLWRDRARREINARSKGIAYEGGDDAIAQSSAQDDGEQALLATLEHEAVRQAMLRLEPKHREAIVLYHYQEMTYDEIAQTLRVPVGTVRSRLHYAIEALRHRLVPTVEGVGR